MRKTATSDPESGARKRWYTVLIPAAGCKLQAQQGFTLLLAALIASVVLSIGASIFSIALKQVALASAGRNSQFAFYAADTGSECALYQDVRFAAFATSTSSHPPATIACDVSSAITPTFPANPDNSPNPSANAATTTFQYEPNGKCAQVTVAKNRSGAAGGIITVIRSDGYSTACARIATDPQALQRSVELHY